MEDAAGVPRLLEATDRLVSGRLLPLLERLMVAGGLVRLELLLE